MIAIFVQGPSISYHRGKGKSSARCRRSKIFTSTYRLIAKDLAWIEYNRLKAAKAWKRLSDAELMVGRARSILSENGFSCSELTLRCVALRRWMVTSK
ncbi:hypothetical protein M405DRAFT_130366 [Rhizopogon salebrosus TDB-379]|nr:hypothetical protein M405DRAFT_130366 [Rhizopogon salebrosus TDB-379]